MTNAAAALDDDDGGATAAITLGGGDEEFRLTGFPGFYDEIQIVKVIAGVRYRTTGLFVDQLYRIEASRNDQFRSPPGFDISTTNWNFYTPIVGAGGPNAPVVRPDYGDARLLVAPNVGPSREVSATLTGNPVLPPGAGEYEWPALTHADLANATLRVAAVSVGIKDGEAMLDLSYQEDAGADVDMNIVMTGEGKFVEIQGTAEKIPFGDADLTKLLAVAKTGIQAIVREQKKVL